MAETIILGNARECIAKLGKWQGRSRIELAAAVKEVMMQKSRSTSGVVSSLCISPANGSRAPCDDLQVKQSIVGDCQSKEGWVSPASAKIKNNGALLGDDNIFVESLLTGVTVGDADIVQEVLLGAPEPRLDKVWVTGDNVYVSGLDMSWNNFRVGDLLVLPGTVIVNSGYPHSACWKYAARAGEQPKDYINSEQGNELRMRGIKGSFLLRSQAEAFGIIRTTDFVHIVHRDTIEYDQILSECRTPLEMGTELVFHMEGKEMRAEADDTRAYVDLLICAGSEAGRLDYLNYSRSLPTIAKQELGIVMGHPEKPETMEICPAALSGDGTTEHVGIKMDGKFQCPDCVQKFLTDRACKLHWKFHHDPDFERED